MKRVDVVNCHRCQIVISLAMLTLSGIIDHRLGNLTVLIFYIASVAYAANFVGGRYAYVYACAASILRLTSVEFMQFLEVNDLEEILWSFINIFGTNLLIVYLILSKNKVLRDLETTTLTDPLTKLTNRRGFKQRLDSAIYHTRRYNEQLSIAYIDVDNFKQVNDVYGHAKGDELLKLISRCINGCLRSEDTCARLGGDEFAIIFIHSNNSIGLIQRIKHHLDCECSKNYGVSFSIGIVHYDGKHHASGEDITHYADSLMYNVKKTSKNAILSENYQPSMEK